MPASVELEEDVCKWYAQEQSKGVSVRGADVQSGAERLAKDLKSENFSARNGWLWRFRNRHGLRNGKVCGEALRSEANKGSVKRFRQKVRQLIDSGRGGGYNCIRFTARATLAFPTDPFPKIHKYRSMTQIPLAENSPRKRSHLFCV
jgi:hypothetical protein